MGGEWRDVTIDDIKAPTTGAIAIGPFGSRMKADRYVDVGVPVIRGNNLGDAPGFTGDFVYVSEETAAELRSCTVRAGDLVFPHRGAIGSVGLVPLDSTTTYVMSTSLMKLSCNRDIADPRFLYYFFRSDAGRHALLRNASTVGTPGIGQPLASLRSIALKLPSLHVQRRIVESLSSLDAQIDLNRRVSATLESLARALFKSWFVDFDPVRAKAEGRETGLPEQIAVLFPEAFQPSEVGEIPRGWHARTLGDIAEHSRRVLAPSEIAADRPYIALEHMPRRSIALNEWALADGVESNKYEFRKGDILFGKLRPYFHKVGIAPVDGVCSTDIVVLKPSAPHWCALVLGHASSDEFVSHTYAGSTGTRMPRTTWEEMSRYRIAAPSAEVAAALTSVIQPIVARIIAATHMSRSLATLRNLLLPRLLAGDSRAGADR